MNVCRFKKTAALCISAILLTGCKAPEEKAAPVKPPVQEEDKIRIGVTFYSLRNEFTVRIVNAVQDRANELGIELVVYDGNYDSGMQILQVEEMLKDGVDGILLNPQDVDACAPCVDLAADAGIPVVGVNTKVNSERLVSYVGSRDQTAGTLLMEKAAELLEGQGKIVVLEGPIGQSSQVERNEGIHEILKKYPDITILSEKSGNWSRSESMSITKNWLESFEHFDLVIAENDEMALGAADAVREAGADILILGLDGSPEAITAVQNGELAATFFQDAETQGTKAVEVLLDCIEGRKIKKNYWIAFEEVTQENAEYFLTSRLIKTCQ